MATIKNRKKQPITPEKLKGQCPAGVKEVKWDGLLRLVADKRNPDEQWWVDYRSSPNDAAAIKGSERSLRLAAN